MKLTRSILLSLLLGVVPASAWAQAKKPAKGKDAPAAAAAKPAAPPAGGAAANAPLEVPDKPAQGGDQPAAVKIERGAGGKKIYKIETAIKIEGKIQKPEAFYVLQKSSINYEWTELKQQFLPKILDSVSKAPF
jgi:hypothetical protein